MKKIAISLLVLALVAAFSATGVVSAATCGATTAATTTSAQCTSCTTSTCCCCPCPVVTCCCPVVTCCVVTKCCEVKEVKEVKAAPVKDWDHKDGKPTAGAVAMGGAAATTGGQAVNQEIKQKNEAAVTINGDSNIVTINQGNIAGQIAVPIKIDIKDVTINPAVAWNGGQATTGGDNTKTEAVPAL